MQHDVLPWTSVRDMMAYLQVCRVQRLTPRFKGFRKMASDLGVDDVAGAEVVTEATSSASAGAEVVTEATSSASAGASVVTAAVAPKRPPPKAARPKRPAPSTPPVAPKRPKPSAGRPPARLLQRPMPKWSRPPLRAPPARQRSPSPPGPVEEALGEVGPRLPLLLPARAKKGRRKRRRRIRGRWHLQPKGGRTACTRRSSRPRGRIGPRPSTPPSSGRTADLQGRRREGRRSGEARLGVRVLAAVLPVGAIGAGGTGSTTPGLLAKGS